MKILLAWGLSCLVVAPAWAAEYAQVLSVTPVYGQYPITQPRTRCWNDQVKSPNVGDYGEENVVSQVSGGSLGHGFADNSTPRSQADLAAVVGSSVAGQLHPETSTTYGHHCVRGEVTNFENRVINYRVVYVENGAERTTSLSYDPGAHIRLDHEDEKPGTVDIKR